MIASSFVDKILSLVGDIRFSDRLLWGDFSLHDSQPVADSGQYRQRNRRNSPPRLVYNATTGHLSARLHVAIW